MQIDKTRVIRAGRISIALTIGFILAGLINLPHAMWVPITIIVVLFDQYTVGGALQRSAFRVAATIISAIIAVVAIYVFHNNAQINNAIIVIGTFIYAYKFMDTKQSYIGIIGSITLAMILSGSEGINTPIFRSIAIILGVLIAVFAMMVFFPKYAKHHLVVLFTHTLNTQENIIRQFVNNEITPQQIRDNFVLFEARFIAEVTRISRTLDEAKFEIKSSGKVHPYPQAIIHLRRIYRLFGVLVQNIPNNEVRSNQQIIKQLEKIANIFSQLQQILLSQQINYNAAKLKKFTLPTPDIEFGADNDLIFIYSLVKLLTYESNALLDALAH